MSIRSWSTTAANNNSSPPNGWPEGMAPSGVNNVGRQMMAEIRDSFEALPWFDYGHTPTRVDNDTFTVSTDLTSTYVAGRRLKLVGATTGYATISSSSYSAPNTTVNVTMDSGNIPTSLSTVSLGPEISTGPIVPYYKITSAEQSAGVTPVNYAILAHEQVGFVNPFRYMTTAQMADVIARTALQDVTTPLVNAIAVAEELGAGWVYPPPGRYLVTSTLTISSNFIDFVGAGHKKTEIVFTPTANDILFHLINGATTINQGSIGRLSIWSAESTYTKTAIDITDMSGYRFYDLVIGGDVVVGSRGMWSGANSVGLRIRGRDTSGLSNIKIFADKPIQISVNPNDANISLDQTNFHNTYLCANGNPNVTIDADVVLSQVSFTGYFSTAFGTSALTWNDSSASPGSSTGLYIDNLRHENPENVTDYMLDIRLVTKMNNLVIRGGTTSGCRGFRLRGINQVKLSSFIYADTSREAINLDNTDATYADVDEVVLSDFRANTGSTATLTGMIVVADGARTISAPVPINGRLIDSTAYAYAQDTTNASIAGPAISLTAGSTVDFAFSGGYGEVRILNDTDENYAVFSYGAAATAEVLDAATAYSTSSATANSINCYYNGGTTTYRINNGHGTTKSIRIVRIGKA